MLHCDVLIVGGGPAGSTCAWKLRRAGLSVAVLDKKSFPRDKPCAGWITPPVVKLLELDVEDYRGGRVWQTITGFASGTIGGRTTRLSYGAPVSFGILRREFDAYLLARSGAESICGRPLKSLERDGSAWVANGEIAAKVVVGAGGHFCPVARRLGARSEPAAAVVKAQEVEFSATGNSAGNVLGEMPEIYFCPDLEGYGWCFRKGEMLNVGLGRLRGERLSEHVEGFCEFLRERGAIAGEIPKRFLGHAYQLYERIVPRLTGDGMLLIGDAAGLAYPNSGEGIRPAVESALLAADAIVRRMDNAGDGFSDYESAILKRFGAPPRGDAISWLPRAWLAALGARLLANRWFARKVVFERWFLRTNEPPLAV